MFQYNCVKYNQTCLAQDWNIFFFCACLSNHYDNDQLRCLLNASAAKRNIKLKGQAGLGEKKK